MEDILDGMLYGTRSRVAWTIIALELWAIAILMLVLGAQTNDFLGVLSVVILFSVMALMVTAMVTEMWWVHWKKIRIGPIKRFVQKILG